MKRTKNMIYQPSDEAVELLIMAKNDGRLYSTMKAIVSMLAKHYKKGGYNAEKAVDAWYPYMTLVSKDYYYDCGYAFTVTERYTAAVDMEEDMREWVME